MEKNIRKPIAEKKKIKLWCLCAAAFLLAVVLVSLSFQNGYVRIHEELENMVSASIQELTRQSAHTLATSLKDRFTFLESIAGDIGNHPENVKSLIEGLSSYAEGYQFKRVWFMDTDGNAVTSDGKADNFAYRDYFQKSIQGKYTISGVLNDMLAKGTQINVLSLPVHDSAGDIIGVVGATYDAQIFREMLDIDAFDGMSIGYIVDENGEIISSSSKAPLFMEEDSNFFEGIRQKEAQGDAIETGLRRIIAMQGYEISTVVTGENYDFCCESLENQCPDLPWFLVTVTSVETVNGKLSHVLSSVQMLLIMVAEICAVLIVVALLIYRYYNHSLRRAVYVDPLTGGDNYAGFLLHMQDVQEGYLVSAELDNDLKLISGMFGSQKGDEVLRGMYESIVGRLRKDEYAARVSDDRFVFYLHEDRRPPVYERLRQIERDILRLSGQLGVLHMAPHFGVYVMREGDKIERCCELSNLALGIACGQNNKTVAFYQDIDQNAFFDSLKMEDRFESALQEHQFEVFYQPKCNPQSGAIVAAEGLVRWRQADGSLLSPGYFIPLFEQNGSIGKLDEYMFTSICEQLSQWKQKGLTIHPVSVNLSRASLRRPGIALTYKRILEGYGLSTWMVPLEVTESAMISDNEVLDVMQEFYRYGFRIEIDDFGRGQSTIPMLKLPFVDTVKLDKSLIDCIGDHKGEIILRQVVSLCYELGLYTTAEGVEKQDQVEFLRALGCTDIQGYYFYAPMPSEKFGALLTQQDAKNGKQA